MGDTEKACVVFGEELRQALRSQEVLPDDWKTTADVIRETGRILGVSYGRKEDKKTWWCTEKKEGGCTTHKYIFCI